MNHASFVNVIFPGQRQNTFFTPVYLNGWNFSEKRTQLIFLSTFQSRRPQEEVKSTPSQKIRSFFSQNLILSLRPSV